MGERTLAVAMLAKNPAVREKKMIVLQVDPRTAGACSSLRARMAVPKKKTPHKTGYQSDCSDEEWAFCAPYLTLMNEEAPQREHRLRKVFDALRYLVREGCPWRMIPNDLPPWHAVYDQARRWIAAGVHHLDHLPAYLSVPR